MSSACCASAVGDPRIREARACESIVSARIVATTARVAAGVRRVLVERSRHLGRDLPASASTKKSRTGSAGAYDGTARRTRSSRVHRVPRRPRTLAAGERPPHPAARGRQRAGTDRVAYGKSAGTNSRTCGVDADATPAAPLVHAGGVAAQHAPRACARGSGRDRVEGPARRSRRASGRTSIRATTRRVAVASEDVADAGTVPRPSATRRPPTPVDGVGDHERRVVLDPRAEPERPGRGKSISSPDDHEVPLPRPRASSKRPPPRRVDGGGRSCASCRCARRVGRDPHRRRPATTRCRPRGPPGARSARRARRWRIAARPAPAGRAGSCSRRRGTRPAPRRAGSAAFRARESPGRRAERVQRGPSARTSRPGRPRSGRPRGGGSRSGSARRATRAERQGHPFDRRHDEVEGPRRTPALCTGRLPSAPPCSPLVSVVLAAHDAEPTSTRRSRASSARRSTISSSWSSTTGRTTDAARLAAVDDPRLRVLRNESHSVSPRAQRRPRRGARAVGSPGWTRTTSRSPSGSSAIPARRRQPGLGGRRNGRDRASTRAARWNRAPDAPPADAPCAGRRSSSLRSSIRP